MTDPASDSADLSVSAQPTPEVAALPQEMTPAQLAEAKEYGRLSLTCDLVDKVLDVAFLGVVTLFLAVPVDAWLAQYLPAALPRLVMCSCC